jgi:hypothetical protein
MVGTVAESPPGPQAPSIGRTGEGEGSGVAKSVPLVLLFPVVRRKHFSLLMQGS